MLCYKGMTFCEYLGCANKKCRRRITDKIKQEAERVGLPIAKWAGKPNCYIESENKNEEMR